MGSSKASRRGAAEDSAKLPGSRGSGGGQPSQDGYHGYWEAASWFFLLKSVTVYYSPTGGKVFLSCCFDASFNHHLFLFL